MKKLKLIEHNYKNCSKCPELVKNRTQVVFGHGNINADLFLLGEAPGRYEDSGGLPFSGRAGRLLNKIIAAIGLKRKDIWIGNACLCRPPNNRTPFKKEIDQCHTRLIDEIRAISPKVVVAMGATPLFALTKLSGVNKNRGWVPSKYHNAVFCTYHPAAMLYDPNKKPKAWKDWQEIARKLNAKEAF